ncbi:hypothetical protein C0Z18_28840 [Trinickia dabaoshanensis]|uniref:DUF2182 domain-containing protein n=1 Tax=Trinickia dabaoshanensis TaxID=564714 RepID=A0A2N7VD33_9BURK|nr:DUF2182 domain-containing protein [Trinickia dabaoshanensis]PMS15037.1 hypothetical protein C0Z18_28840 [Trinickia dabaoshanensis]
MGEIPMPGGWSMSAMWMPMCGQSWLGAALTFVGMWTWMMAAMMLPLWTPAWRRFLSRYRSPTVHAFLAAHRSPISCWGAAARTALLTGVCYLLSWAAAGAIVFALGNALAANLPHVPMLARFVPLLSAGLTIIAGAVQFTPWKMTQIACCRYDHACESPSVVAPVAACKRGGRAALRDGYCCGNLMAVLLVAGVMNLPAMAGLTAAMSIERLAPADGRAAYGIGAIVSSIGVYMAARAILTL